MSDLDPSPAPGADLDADERATRERLYARYRPTRVVVARPRRADASVWTVRVALLAVVVMVVGLRWWATRAVPRKIDRAPIDIAGEPHQEEVNDREPIQWRHENDVVTIKPLARYRIAGRVVGTSRYRFGWQGALVPWDVGLVWGKMTSDEVLEHIHFQQSGRFLHYLYSAKLPVDEGYVINHAANNHWIPASQNVRRAIGQLDEGDLLEAEGYLVRAERAGGGDWSSSLTRSDTGDGACELMYVTRLKVGARVYE
ncbi:MAG: hypothetical protein IPK07_13180 [Deltaproteobacteria bacterium]|nr:hypothetical protein [Deltaproteobacteria bacterium]